jgi:hypothetical protein
MHMNFDEPGGRSLTDPLPDIALTSVAPNVRRNIYTRRGLADGLLFAIAETENFVPPFLFLFLFLFFLKKKRRKRSMSCGNGEITIAGQTYGDGFETVLPFTYCLCHRAVNSYYPAFRVEKNCSRNVCSANAKLDGF